MQTTHYYREVLASELERRSRRNARYSLRAFAKSLEMSPAGLSRVLSGDRPLSLKTAEKVTARLGLADRRRRLFLDSVAADLRGRDLARAAAPVVERTDAKPIAGATFQDVADWEHFAILELTYLKDFRAAPEWIAGRLNIAPARAAAALQKLVSLGLLVEEGGALRKATSAIVARVGEADRMALKQHQRQLLERGLESLERDAAETRVVTTVMMPIDPVRLEAARRMIEEFSWNLCRYLADGDATEVYTLNVTLAPVKPVG